jgi:hypothetical protein
MALADGTELYGNSYKITIEWQYVTFVGCFNSEQTFWNSPGGSMSLNQLFCLKKKKVCNKCVSFSLTPVFCKILLSVS